AALKSATTRASPSKCSPRVESRRASRSPGSASGATRTSCDRPILRMTRAVAPMLAAILGRTRTTRQLFRDMGLSSRRLASAAAAGAIQGKVAQPLHIHFAAAQDGQFGHEIKIALRGDPQVGQTALAQMVAYGSGIGTVQRQVQNDQPFAAGLVRNTGRKANSLAGLENGVNLLFQAFEWDHFT